MAAQLSEKSQSKLQERHFLFTFSEMQLLFFCVASKMGLTVLDAQE